MKDFLINVTQVEELQTLKDIHALDNIFSKAKSAIVNGERVIMVRKTKNHPPEKFDELSTLDELENYHHSVFKYLSP